LHWCYRFLLHWCYRFLLHWCYRFLGRRVGQGRRLQDSVGICPARPADDLDQAGSREPAE